MSNRNIQVQIEPFDAGLELSRLGALSSQVGGLVSFVGLVRDLNNALGVSNLYLEHYPGMTERQLTDIVSAAEQRWQIIGATVIHRIGELQPGDPIVFVGVASQHRGDAFQACEFIMDYLKTRATFWKKEQTEAGARWVDARDSDSTAAARWQVSDDGGARSD